MPYAESTTVEASKSQADIAALIVKHGATGYQYGWDEGKAAVMFRSHARMVRFTIAMPAEGDPRFRVTDTGRARANPRAAYDAEVRRRWRTLYLTIKAKLIAVEDGVSSFEEEFLANILLPDGTTVYESIQERLQLAYDSGDPVDLLPRLPSPRQIEGPR